MSKSYNTKINTCSTFLKIIRAFPDDFVWNLLSWCCQLHYRKSLFSLGGSWCILNYRARGCIMEGRLHGSVRATPRIWAELQAPNRKLAVRYRLSVKTVAKSRLCSTTKDSRMGPATLLSAKLIPSNDEIVVETDNAAAEASSREHSHSWAAVPYIAVWCDTVGLSGPSSRRSCWFGR